MIVVDKQANVFHFNILQIQYTHFHGTCIVQRDPLFIWHTRLHCITYYLWLLTFLTVGAIICFSLVLFHSLLSEYVCLYSRVCLHCILVNCFALQHAVLFPKSVVCVCVCAHCIVGALFTPLAAQMNAVWFSVCVFTTIYCDHISNGLITMHIAYSGYSFWMHFSKLLLCLHECYCLIEWNSIHPKSVVSCYCATHIDLSVPHNVNPVAWL
jgi:hypothetical protein